MTDDDIYPRDTENRYRIYACIGDERHVLATAPTAQGVGLALITMHDDQRSIGRRLCDHGRIGLLDTMPGGEPSATGDWVIPPWHRQTAEATWTDPETGDRTPLGQRRRRSG